MTRALLSSRSRVLIQFLAVHIYPPVVTPRKPEKSCDAKLLDHQSRSHQAKHPIAGVFILELFDFSSDRVNSVTQYPQKLGLPPVDFFLGTPMMLCLYTS